MASTVIDRATGVALISAIKAPCVAATTANITLYGEQTIDGVAVVAGDRVLVKNQTVAAENGVYVVDTGGWDRAPDFDSSRDIQQYVRVYIGAGSENANSEWALATDSPIPDTSGLSFVRVNPDHRANLPEILGAVGLAPSLDYTSTVSAAIASIKSRALGEPLVINGGVRFNADITIDVPIVFAPGAYFTVTTGHTVTIAETVSAPIQHIFRGAGSYVAGGSGEQPRSVHVEWFGVEADGVTDDSDAMQRATTFATGGQLLLANGVHKITKKWTPGPHTEVVGVSYDADVAIGGEWTLRGSVILACGTATKDCYARGVTDGRTSGGRIDNSADADFGSTDAYLSLASFYNEDANTSTGAAATPAAFSAAIYLPMGTAGVRLRDFRVILNHSGVDGYNDGTATLADNWDVGIYMDNTRYCEIENVQVLGYWRKAGRLIRSGALAFEVAANEYAGAEENKARNCVFQGWKSSSLRGIDMFKAQAVTSTYIEVPWSANHPFDMVNQTKIGAGEFSTTHITITGVSKVGSALRLTTATSQVGIVAVGDPIAPDFYGNGISGTIDTECRFHAMWHTSGRRISDPAITGAMAPSACAEISGARIRGWQTPGCKFQSPDDIAIHQHQCLDTIIGPNARFEGVTPTGGSAGMRMLSTPTDAVAYPDIVRPTYKTQLHCEQIANTDFTPQFGSRPAKFSADGWFAPSLFGQIYHGGLFPGDPTTNTLFREYSIGNFTPVVSFETPGNLAVTSQTRAGVAEVCGEYVNFYLRLTATLTHSTASGKLTISLPKTVYNTTNMFVVMPCIASNITFPAGRTQLHAEAQPNTATAYIAATGSAVAKSYIDTTNILTGTAITLEISGSYRISR